MSDVSPPPEVMEEENSPGPFRPTTSSSSPVEEDEEMEESLESMERPRETEGRSMM